LMTGPGANDGGQGPRVASGLVGGWCAQRHVRLCGCAQVLVLVLATEDPRRRPTFGDATRGWTTAAGVGP
jgi:hypothetical protein